MQDKTDTLDGSDGLLRCWLAGI